MKLSLRSLVCSLFLSAATAQYASAELLTNGNFTGVTDANYPSLTYGQFGTGSGSNLSIPSWSTTGYNFVFSPGTADQGHKASGSNNTSNEEAPGEYNVAVTNGSTTTNYGSTFLWGPGNGGVTGTTATDPFSSPNLPFAGNFIAADAIFQTQAITTTVNGLRTGQAYTLTFYWATAQQESYTGNNDGNSWQVSLGSQTFSTPTVNQTSKAFTGWMSYTTTFNYTGTNTSATLSFLASQVVPSGGTGGNPPFLLLGGVSLVPEPSSGSLLSLVGVGLTAGWLVRRRRLAASVQG